MPAPTLLPSPVEGGGGLRVRAPRYDAGTVNTTPIEAFLPAGRVAKTEWVPATSEVGLSVGGAFVPVYPPLNFYPPFEYASRTSYALDYPDVVAVQTDHPAAIGFPAASFPINLAYMQTATPQLLSAVCLDTELDPVRNPGLLVASASLYRYPGRIGRGDTGFACAHPTYRWSGSVAWDAATQLLTITADTAPTIRTSTDGSRPADTYSGPLSLSATTTVRFRFLDAGNRPGPIFAVTVTYTGDAPEASFTRAFPTVQYDDWDDSGTSLPPSGWEADCGIAYRITYGATTPASPTPQTRSAAAVGTRVTGRFLPDPLVSGTLKAIAYRYGCSLSAVASFAVTVKIGKIVATWSSSAQTLTLSTPTSGAALSYSTDGSAPATAYAGPIALTGTTIVRVKATKSGLGDSDTHEIPVTYAAGAPPADFARDLWTALADPTPATTAAVAVAVCREPTYFCAPGASGSGTSPDDPADVNVILGKCTPLGASMTPGKAFPPMEVLARYTASGANWYGSLDTSRFPSLASGAPTVYYGLNAAPSTLCTYPGPALTTSTTVHYELRNAAGTEAIGPVWTFTHRVGVDTVTASWDAETKRLTLTGLPDHCRVNCDAAATPAAEYLGPIEVTDPVDLRVRAISTTGTTDIVAVPAIDPDTTESFTHALVLTWTSASKTVMTYRRADVVWLAEGTYQSDSTTQSLCVLGYGIGISPLSGVEVFGGFSSDFTKRDRNARRTVIDIRPTVDYGAGLFNAGYVDGVHFDVGLSTRALLAIGAGYGVYAFCKAAIGWADGVTPLSAYNTQTMRHSYGCAVEYTLPERSPCSGLVANVGSTDGWQIHGTVSIDFTGSGEGAATYTVTRPMQSSVAIDSRAGRHAIAVGTGIIDGTTLTCAAVSVGPTNPSLSVSLDGTWADSAIDIDATSSAAGAGSGASSTIAVTLPKVCDTSVSIDATAGAPDGSGSSSATVSGPLAVGSCPCRIALDTYTGAPGGGVWAQGGYPYSPTDELEILSLTEDLRTTYAGNQERPNATVGSSAWFGGTPNGYGAPIAGHEVKQGLGTQYGRYWE